jgi:Mg2+ and Co2+ transporter CorA
MYRFFTSETLHITQLTVFIDLSLGYNTLHNTPRRKHPTWEEEMYRDRPHGKRVWNWLLLCEDRTIITVYEDPFPQRNGMLTQHEQLCLGVIRRNLINIFRQLSKGHDHSRDVASKQLPLRTRIGDVEEETTHRPTDIPGLLFYYLFDDWENIYTYIAQGNGYAEEIDRLRECMLTKAELEHVDRLHHIGRKLGVLKRLYQSYDSLIDQVLKKQEATLASLKNSHAFPSGMQSMEQSVGQLADPNLMGVPLSSASRMRFETLKRRIRLYALNEVEECLLQKESLTMVNFNLIAIKESYSVERLTRITLLLAKVTMLFMPVSLMTGYFSSQLTDARFTVKSYWTWFAVVLSASILGLCIFDILSGSNEGKMDLRSYGTKIKELLVRLWAGRRRKDRALNFAEE